MKLQIAFDLTDLDKALALAEATQSSSDIMEVGSLLISKQGVLAVERFKNSFPHKIIFADAKILDRSKDAVTLFAQAGADWITVMAGANKNTIHTACTTAHELGKKIVLDLLDASSLGQSALEAKSLGVDALIIHKTPEDDQVTFADRWEMVKGNTSLPIYILPWITRDTITDIRSLKPAGVIIGPAITQAQDPQQEAAYYVQHLHEE
jgi:3-hexulose-6-phosphate synthase